jgi:hypothetical protein
MLMPKVTLQGEVGETRSFVVNGKFVHLRAQVPRAVPRKLEKRLRGMKQKSGLPLFKITEVRVPEKVQNDPPKIISSGKVQHVDGSAKENIQHVEDEKNAAFKQKRFAQCR